MDADVTPSRWRTIATALGYLACAPLVVLSVAAVLAPATPWGMGYLSGLVLCVAAFVLARQFRRAPWLALAGIAVVVLVAIARLGAVAHAPALTAIVLPGPRPARWTNALIDERDAALFGLMALDLTGGLERADVRALDAAMTSGCNAMRAHEGPVSSPVLATFLGRESPAAFDALVVAPAGPPRFGVLFLHGAMGNTAVQCWHFAQPVRALGGITMCPSVGPDANWWLPPGEATVRIALRDLRAHGVTRVYLAGISRGGYGAGLLAPRMREDFAGLILVSGTPDEPARSGLPTLVLHGTEDTWMSPDAARDYARAQGESGTLVEFATGHFLLLDRAAEVRSAIESWLRSHGRESVL